MKLNLSSFTIILLSFNLLTASAFAADYISSVYNGNQLTNDNGMARVGKWKPENKLEFTGYGLIKMNNLCLSARQKGFITWQPCTEKAKFQIWSLKDKALTNELGLCAEIESFTQSVVLPRLMSRKCADVPQQKWQEHTDK
ncbi:hypothetical protein K2P97_08245 [bacterium]|nr:hypothetical protein [bacterium]